MPANTIVLIIVTAVAMLALAGALVWVTYKTKAPKRAETIRDQVEEDALRLRRHEALADEFAARVHAAQVEIDIKTVQACSLQQQATAHRDEAVASRKQLNEYRRSTDKPTAAGQPSTVPRFAG